MVHAKWIVAGVDALSVDFEAVVDPRKTQDLEPGCIQAPPAKQASLNRNFIRHGRDLHGLILRRSPAPGANHSIRRDKRWQQASSNRGFHCPLLICYLWNS